jgi:hypothetical protein
MNRREDDERLLDLLARHRRGERLAQTARRQVLRVIKADCAHDPEALTYWSQNP